MVQSQNLKRYDLEGRTLEYGKRIISLSKYIIKNPINLPLISQFIRSGTSVGANYREANETSTKKDFLFRMRICRKEAKETLYWLDMIVEANPDLGQRVEPLIKETSELVKIFASIIVNSEKKE